MPKIMQGPEDIEATSGDEMKFACHVIGTPKPDIKWMLDSNEIHVDGSHRLVESDGTLVIFNVTEDDVGEYECVAENEMGSMHSRKARAIVTVSPTLRFETLPETQTVLLGQDVTFACKVKGNPEPFMEWWRNGYQLVEGGRITVEARGQFLKIASVKRSDAARYVCRGRNVNGFTETSADLNVVSEDKEPPAITYEPENMEAEEGMSIEIACRAKGSPKPVIQWKKDGTTVSLARARVSRGGSLFLQNITAQDAGR